MEENRFTWNLEDIYPDEQAWYQDLSKAKELTAKLAAMQGKVCQDGHTLLEALDLSTKCSEYIAKLFTYASCHYDAQMGNAGYKKLYETICGENSAAAEQTSFLMPELMELTRESFDRLCAQVPELALYTHYIEDLLSQKEHILDERSEQMLVRMQDIHSSFKKSTPTCVSTTPRARRLPTVRATNWWSAMRPTAQRWSTRTALSAKSFLKSC